MEKRKICSICGFYFYREYCRKCYTWGDRIYHPGPKLGEGRYFNCYKVTDMETHTQYALKVLKSDCENETKMVKHEYEMYMRLDHKNIVRCYGMTSKPQYSLILEICEKTLEKYLEDKKIIENEMKRIIIQITEGVRHIHQCGIIHRDLSFGNILLTASGDIKICDFGFAITEEEALKDKTICGTLNFMAPETLKGDTINTKCDIWSIGVIMYYILTRTLPFKCENRADTRKKILKGDWELPSDISSNIKDLLSELLEFDPSKRIDANQILHHDFLVS